jgi:hypothetical protein
MPTSCQARGGCASGWTSCCDACGNGGCNPTTSTTTLTSTSTTTTSSETTSTVTTSTSTTTTTVPSNVCGNGIVESPEWCDGESFCDSNCTIHRYACCEFATGGGACSADVPAYTLFAYQNGVCGNYGGTFRLGKIQATGGACADPPSGPPYSSEAGACAEPPPLAAPISLCCQSQSTGPYCSATFTADNDVITGFIWNCAYNHYPNIPIVRGTCGGDGNCVFAP